MAFGLKALAQLFYWLIGIEEVERKVEVLKVEQEEMKGDLRQTRQKTDSLWKLVEQMRRKEDWF